LQVEVELAFGDQRGQVQRHGAQHRFAVDHRGFALLPQLFHLGQRQHLVGQFGGAVDRGADLAQRLLHVDIAAARRLHLRLQHRQRCAQLVRRVAHEALLVVQQPGQAGHDGVGGVDHGCSSRGASAACTGDRSSSARPRSWSLSARTGRVARCTTHTTTPAISATSSACCHSV
jgi:hypothetical protein